MFGCNARMCTCLHRFSLSMGHSSQSETVSNTRSTARRDHRVPVLAPMAPWTRTTYNTRSLSGLAEPGAALPKGEGISVDPTAAL